MPQPSSVPIPQEPVPGPEEYAPPPSPSLGLRRSPMVVVTQEGVLQAQTFDNDVNTSSLGLRNNVNLSLQEVQNRFENRSIFCKPNYNHDVDTDDGSESELTQSCPLYSAFYRHSIQPAQSLTTHPDRSGARNRIRNRP